uniref:Phytochrome A-associated F-box protein n=1 Tax=Leersia perrieri TaxID=77586 RepID=A0A0D9WFN8_9ORYZ
MSSSAASASEKKKKKKAATTEEEGGDGGGGGSSSSSASPLWLLADDVLLQILGRLEGDPRDWARASCASPRLAALLRGACLPPRLTRALPAELLPAPAPDGAPRAWAALHKLSVCCPGLLRAGVLLHPPDDLGLELDIGPNLPSINHTHIPSSSPSSSTATSAAKRSLDSDPDPHTWSLYDDLYLDAAYDSPSSSSDPPPPPPPQIQPPAADETPPPPRRRRDRRWVGTVGAHLATGAWTLSREQGNKLLASRFRGDALYICDWPGCVHAEERRKYMVFRGVFRDFPRSQVRRALRDTRHPAVAVDCAFCGSARAWDLYSAFCLRSFYGYHDDGEPVVRAYVCENGHVAGAWTERPLYS